MHSITGLATDSALTAVEDKIPNVSNLVKKTDYDSKISDIEKKTADHNHDKYITTPEFNNLAARVFNARLAEANLATKTDFDAKLQSFNEKINSNKTKHLLVENEIKNLNNFDAAYFRGKNYIGDDGMQNYLAFQPVYKYFELNSGVIISWESKGLSNEKISFLSRLHKVKPPTLVYNNVRIKVKFRGYFLNQDKIIYNHGPIVNIYVVYRLSPRTDSGSIDPTLQNCLFGSVELTKNADIDKYKYSGYGIGFDSGGSFTHPSGGAGRNVFIFGAHLSSFKHVNNKTRNISALGGDFIQGIDDTTIYAEKMYSTNLTLTNNNGDNSYLFVNGKEIIKCKAKDSEIVPYPLCLEGISKDFTVSYILNTGLIGYIYDFSVDYWAIANDKILDIHKYLMKKRNII